MPSSSQVANAVLLRVPGHDRIFALSGGHSLNRMGAANGARACFGQAEVQNLTLLDQLFNRTGDILDWHLRIDTVLVVEVDAIGSQPLGHRRGHFDLSHDRTRGFTPARHRQVIRLRFQRPPVFLVSA